MDKDKNKCPQCGYGKSFSELINEASNEVEEECGCVVGKNVISGCPIHNLPKAIYEVEEPTPKSLEEDWFRNLCIGLDEKSYSDEDGLRLCSWGDAVRFGREVLAQAKEEGRREEVKRLEWSYGAGLYHGKREVAERTIEMIDRAATRLVKIREANPDKGDKLTAALDTCTHLIAQIEKEYLD